MSHASPAWGDTRRYWDPCFHGARPSYDNLGKKECQMSSFQAWVVPTWSILMMVSSLQFSYFCTWFPILLSYRFLMSFTYDLDSSKLWIYYAPLQPSCSKFPTTIVRSTHTLVMDIVTVGRVHGLGASCLISYSWEHRSKSSLRPSFIIIKYFLVSEISKECYPCYSTFFWIFLF